MAIEYKTAVGGALSFSVGGTEYPLLIKTQPEFSMQSEIADVTTINDTFPRYAHTGRKSVDDMVFTAYKQSAETGDTEINNQSGLTQIKTLFLNNGSATFRWTYADGATVSFEALVIGYVPGEDGNIQIVTITVKPTGVLTLSD